jgi:hypothetical protein
MSFNINPPQFGAFIHIKHATIQQLGDIKTWMNTQIPPIPNQAIPNHTQDPPPARRALPGRAQQPQTSTPDVFLDRFATGTDAVATVENQNIPLAYEVMTFDQWQRNIQDPAFVAKLRR